MKKVSPANRGYPSACPPFPIKIAKEPRDLHTEWSAKGGVGLSARTKTEAKSKLQALHRDQEDGLPAKSRTYSVREAVESWLPHKLTSRQKSTVEALV